MFQKLKNFTRTTVRKIRLKRLAKKKVVIISNDCWGGEFYKEYKRPFNTPFIGLFLYPPCYVALLKDFDRVISMPLEFIPASGKYPALDRTYPIGLLDGHIEIQFLHYESEDEARDKWNRRVARMLNDTRKKEDYFFKFSIENKDYMHYLNDFYRLPYKNKISMAVWPFPNPAHIVMDGEKLSDGITLYYETRQKFNLLKWLTK